jgi:peptidyl-prolyl cis-trans isomerase A (cyclophilin A)
MKRLVSIGASLLLMIGATRAGTLAQFRTVLGDIEVELYDQDKPATVQNFIRYVESGRYQDGIAHRLVPGLMVKGGAFFVVNRGTADSAINPIPTYDPIPNEFATGPMLSNGYGTLAMARLAGDTNSATSEWFINLADNSFLDANDADNLFVVFGKVVGGTDVLDRLNAFQYWSFPWDALPEGTTNIILHQYYNPPFDDLPLLHPEVADTNFLFVDISLLKLEVKELGSAAREISWNSIAGRTNVLEYTTDFPPAWQPLVTTNGHGGNITVTDESTSPQRFYRVRLLY